MSEYEAWTWQAVRERIIEARRTSMLLPYVWGPKSGASAWPGYKLEHDSERSVRRQAMPGEISRMEEVLRWIADVQDEDHRKLLHDHARLKTTPRARIGVWCEENGWAERIFNRRVTVVCQGIADRLNLNSALRLDPVACEVSEKPAEVVPRALPSRTVLRHSGPDERLRNLPDHEDRKATIRRIERWAAARSRRAKARPTARP